MKIALLACTKAKKNYSCCAKELYSASHLFNLSYQYAKVFCDKIYILSAKYGLVEENMYLEPYDLTLNAMSKKERILWSNMVFEKLAHLEDIEKSTFVILAGKNYYLYFYRKLKRYELPLDRLSFGNRMHKLKEMIANGYVR